MSLTWLVTVKELYVADCSDQRYGAAWAHMFWDCLGLMKGFVVYFIWCRLF